jgi:hypothetical protein
VPAQDYSQGVVSQLHDRPLLLLLSQECLPHIIAALDHHVDEVDIQTKALVLLGVLIQVRTAAGLGAGVTACRHSLCCQQIKARHTCKHVHAQTSSPLAAALHPTGMITAV